MPPLHLVQRGDQPRLEVAVRQRSDLLAGLSDLLQGLLVVAGVPEGVPVPDRTERGIVAIPPSTPTNTTGFVGRTNRCSRAAPFS
jgi:hypothetical protein